MPLIQRQSDTNMADMIPANTLNSYNNYHNIFKYYTIA